MSPSTHEGGAAQTCMENKLGVRAHAPARALGMDNSASSVCKWLPLLCGGQVMPLWAAFASGLVITHHRLLELL